MRIRIPLIRFLLEAGFLILVAAAVGLAGLGWVWIAVIMFCAWLLVAIVERSEARASAPAEEEAESEAGARRGARGGGSDRRRAGARTRA